MRYHAIPGLLLGAVLLLAGCGTTAEEPASADGGSSSAEAAPASLRFTSQTLQGEPFDGAQLAGKPSVLWFWAPWCSTCRAQAAGVTGLADRYEGRVTVVGVGGLADVHDIRDYARQVPGLTHLIDPDGSVWRHFGVTAQSTYVVLDAEGGVVAEGYLDDHVLADKVAELVG